MPKHFRVARYTKDTYFKLNTITYEDGTSVCCVTDEDWQYTYPDNIYEFVDAKCDCLEEIDIVDIDEFDDVLVVMLDDEYERWLRRNREPEDTCATRIKYMNSITEEDATRLLKKNKLNYSGVSCFLTVFAWFPEGIGKKNTNFKLDKETQQMLTDLLIEESNTNDVYVAPYLLPTKTAITKYKNIDGMAEAFICEKLRVTYGDFETQRWHDKRVNFELFYIPVFLRATMESAVCPIYPSIMDENFEIRKPVLTTDGGDIMTDILGEKFSDPDLNDAVYNSKKITEGIQRCLNGSFCYLSRLIPCVEDIPMLSRDAYEAATGTITPSL